LKERQNCISKNSVKNWDKNIFCNFIFVISRGVTTEEGIITAEWIKDHPGQIAALGLGGPEKEFPPIRHKPSFDITSRCNIPAVVHAGETAGTKAYGVL